MKTSKGDFELTLPLGPEQAEGEKILFKFVVDGNWVTSDDYETENDGGNVNNVIYYSNLTATSEEKGSKIPEAGGLVAATGAASAPTGGVTSSSNKENELSTTVMPSEEGKQVTSGEPGIAVPTNASEIKEFSEVRNVNAKDLNEKIKAEEAAEEAAGANGVTTTVLPSSEGKQVTSGEPGIAVPKNAADIKEFSEVRDVNPKDLNEKIKAEEATGPTKTVKVKKVIKKNKITGEEIVVSSEPVDDEQPKTLDPAKDTTKDTTKDSTKTTNGTSSTPAAATTTTTKTTEEPSKTTSSKTTPAKAASTPSKTPKKAASTPAKKEEKSKQGFFSKVKSLLK